MTINGETKILGIFGNPVKHSFSPIMHNLAIKNLGINYVYVPFLVSGDIKTAVNAVRDMNFSGVNVTIPFKEKVIPFLDELSEEAKKIGAVNTIINRDGKLIGDNTDGLGFIRSLKENLKFDVNGKFCFICGAGGASRAIAVSLVLSGAKKVFITDIDLEKAKNLSQIYPDKMSVVSQNEIEKTIKDSDLVVNATPIGMEKEKRDFPFNPEFLTKKNIVYDIIYNVETPLVDYCKNNEIRCLNGLEMLLFQGVLSFEKWTNLNPPVELMRDILIKSLNKMK
jgi:shikimate dehydrogenase